ncbi:MAG TPA: TonB-dependent receptor [Opitutaceae bacterium]|nr:TonB-dependent receptor [Opitutaceae bacterium]
MSSERTPIATNSPKFTQSVADVPQMIDVIPAEVYHAQAATTLSDVLRNTPGITFFAGEGGGANRTGGDAFYLRGFDTSNSIFIDGVRQEGAVVHDTFNLGQVAVYKGPSSENGRGGTAGYIDLETKVPSRHAFGDAEYTHGFSAGESGVNDRVALDINQPVSGAPVAGTALRLNLMDQEGGVPGRRYAQNNRWGVAPSLAFGLGTPTRVFLTYEHLYEHNLPDYGIPSTAVASLVPPATPSAPSLYSPGVSPSSFYGFADYDRERVTDDNGEARIEHDFASGLKLGNQTRYDVDRRFVESTSPQGNATTPAGMATLSHAINATSNTIISNQTNLAATLETGPLEHSLSAGLELSRESADNPTWAANALGTPNPAYLVGIYAPVNFPVALLNYAPHPTGADTYSRIGTAALYGFDTVRFARRWELTGGLRLERYDVDELSTTAAAPAIAAGAARPATALTPASAATSAAAAVAAGTAEMEAARTTAAGKVGLVCKPAPEGSLYLSWASSVRPPGTSGATNTLSATAASADNPLLQPETAYNYEAGVKWEFFRDRLLASFALFRSVNTGVPASDPITGLVDQTSDQTVQGAELSLAGKITRAWLVYAGYAHLEPKVSREISANAQGLTLPLLPKDSGNLWTTYALPGNFTLGAGLQYMGETERLQATQAPTATTFSNQVPAYWLVNAMISYAVNRRLSFQLNAGNLANRSYIASLNNNGFRVNLGAPRSFLLSAEYKF